MTEPTTPQEWIEAHKQARVAEGMPLAEQEMIQALAGVVVVDRLKRAEVVGATKSGRTIAVLVGEPTGAEKHWEQIKATKQA